VTSKDPGTGTYPFHLHHWQKLQPCRVYQRGNSRDYRKSTRASNLDPTLAYGAAICPWPRFGISSKREFPVDHEYMLRSSNNEKA